MINTRKYYVKKYKQLAKDADFAEYLKKQLKNPAIKKAYDEEGVRLEIAYELNLASR